MTFRGHLDDDSTDFADQLDDDDGRSEPASLEGLSAAVDELQRRTEELQAQLAKTAAVAERLDQETTVMDRQLGENFSQVPRKEVWYVAWLGLLLGVANCWRIN